MNLDIKKQMKSFDKQEILNLTNNGLDFYEFVIEDLQMNDIDKCKPTLCPFYEDTKPGFSIYFNYKTKRWQHKDHGVSPSGEEYAGDVFDFAACFYELNVHRDFHQIIRNIAADLGIKLPEEKKQFDEVELVMQDLEMIFTGESEDEYAWLMGFEIFHRGPNDGIDLAHEYFKKFGISKELLKEYNVHAVDWYKKVDKDNKVVSTRVRGQVLNIAYEDIHFAKFYNPDGGFRFWYLGNKPNNYVFGWKQIARRIYKTKIYRDTLIITGGEKDVLTVTSLGYDAICFNSETASVPQDAIENLLPIYNRILILYDIDETGKRRSKELVEDLQDQFKVAAFSLPAELEEKGGKDISDYVALGFDVEKLKNDINGMPVISEELILTVEGSLHESNSKSINESSLLPENVYVNLPNTIKTLCEQFKSRREKDLVLLSTLATISSFFPNVKGIHSGKKVGCNFFLFVTAPASSGKGVMTWSRSLGNGVQQFLKEKFLTESKKYLSDFREFKSTVADNPDAIEPVAPKQQVMFIPANCSVSMIIELLNANQNFGLMFETEGDTLANMLNTEWGNFSDVLRRAFHHEPITMARRKEKEYLQVDDPHLSVVLSGTENQVGNLIKDVENGFFSRMLFYSFRSKIEWQNQFSEYGNELEHVFNEGSSKMLEYWHIQNGCMRCIIRLPENYVAEINRFFAEQLKEFVDSHGEAIVASMKRFGLNFYRIAMILTVIRQLDTFKYLPEELYINETDYHIALQITETLLSHLKIVYQKLENASRTLKLNSKQKLLFEALPDDFTRHQYDNIADELNIKNKTAERYIGIYLKRELIARYDQGKYQKI